jgi:serine protease Do
VTSGIVSGLARTAIGIGDFRSFIQTDAAINPGNSGGALVDLDGRLIGINTAIFSQSGGSIGIGFAIPTNMVRIVLQAAASGGRIVRPWLGAVAQAVTAEIAASLGLPHPQGVLVTGVAPGSPAEQAGIGVGDVILEIDGHEIDDPEGLRFRVATLAMNTSARLTLWRMGARREAVATVIAPPDKPSRQVTTLKGQHPLAGATVANLNPAFAEERGLDATQHGVVVTSLADGSVAQRLGLEAGDIVVSINDHPIPSVDTLRQLVETTHSPWLITVRRGDKLLSVTVRS